MKLLIWLRSFFTAIFYIPYSIVLCSTCIIFSYLGNRKIDNWIVKFWAKYSCRMFGVNVVIKNPEIWEQKTGAVVLFNHSSFFDIFALMGYLNGIRFGAKVELFKIPFFGPAMRRVGVLPIDRSAREKTMQVYQEAVDRIRHGERMALAPEGTRNPDGGLKPFKAGPFVFAIQAQMPLMPVVIRGASKILPKHGILPNTDCWTRTIELELLPPVPTAGLDIDQKSQLQSKIHDEMLKRL